VGGLTFLPVPEGDFVMGKNEEETSPLNPNYIHLFPHPVRVKGFLMARTEVTNAQFRRFLRDNPGWRPENRSDLISREWADEFYLQDWVDGAPPAGKESHPVTNISAYAAEAYCAWLTGQLPSAQPAYVVRLPSEAEWEWAAAGGIRERFITSGSRLYTETSAGTQPAGASAPNLFGLRDMAGNVEEICRDWYAKSAPLLSSRDPAGNPAVGPDPWPAGGQKAVRGGSWATPAEGLAVYRRACLPPYFCNAFLGFRPVIAER
jgi:formylglycine-generating enzyme required for sulfatase activity